MKLLKIFVFSVDFLSQAAAAAAALGQRGAAASESRSGRATSSRLRIKLPGIFCTESDVEKLIFKK